MLAVIPCTPPPPPPPPAISQNFSKEVLITEECNLYNVKLFSVFILFEELLFHLCFTLITSAHIYCIFIQDVDHDFIISHSYSTSVFMNFIQSYDCCYCKFDNMYVNVHHTISKYW